MYFDAVAPHYDAHFTNTEVGRRQRQLVWNYLDKHFSQHALHILELNCGTGVDAVYLAKKGHTVLATDSSASMIEVAQSKMREQNLESVVKTERMAFEEIVRLQPQQFDLIFSDFGGLNCLAPAALKKFSEDISRILKKGGRFVGVIMPKHCIWEQVYFLAKLNSQDAFRRAKGEDVTDKFSVWYYNPSEFANMLGNQFEVKAKMPIGFLLPPSYLNPFFENKKVFLELLEQAEHVVSKAGMLSAFSDHYLIDLQLKFLASNE